MSLIVEDGSGKTDSTSYLSVADGDTYFSTRLNSSKWAGATQPNKEAALVMATRAIDATIVFNGFKGNPNQSLKWPRFQVPDPERVNLIAFAGQSSSASQFDLYLPSNVLPKELKNATAELAIAFLTSDRFADPNGEGIQRMEIFQALKVTFDKLDRQPLIPIFVQQLLSRLGDYIGNTSGVAKLVRV